MYTNITVGFGIQKIEKEQHGLKEDTLCKIIGGKHVTGEKPTGILIKPVLQMENKSPLQKA